MNTISKIREKSKEWWKRNGDTAFLVCAVFLVVLLAAGTTRVLFLWRMHGPITLKEESAETELSEHIQKQYMAASGLPGLIAASRNGTRYYYPWCGGLNRVKETHKVWFPSEQAAEAAGYTLASGCEGP